MSDNACLGSGSLPRMMWLNDPIYGPDEPGRLYGMCPGCQGRGLLSETDKPRTYVLMKHAAVQSVGDAIIPMAELVKIDLTYFASSALTGAATFRTGPPDKLDEPRRTEAITMDKRRFDSLGCPERLVITIEVA